MLYFKETVYEDVEWVYLAHDSVQWRTLVNTVMNLSYDNSRSIQTLKEKLCFSIVRYPSMFIRGTTDFDK
jgi:hypothetical protein